MKTDISEFEVELRPYGLTVLGWQVRRVLVGNAGSAFWPVFSRSPEFSDGAADPLDRWSRRIGEELALRLQAEVVFPFEGPPYPPFLQWAAETGQASASPLSMFIHHQHGLWHAYRFALIFPVESRLPESSIPPSPCLDCRDQPCLEACPVEAFSTGEYRISDCIDYLKRDNGSACRETGCAARQACPVAPGNRYLPEHARFHMAAFLKAFS